LFTIPFSYTRAMAQAEVDWLRAFVDRVRSGEIPWVTEEHLESARLAHQKGNA
jgi:hypothetical protein